MLPPPPEPCSPTLLGTETRFVLRPLGGSLGRAEIALDDMIETTLDAVILIDTRNVVRYWNRGA